MARYRRLPGPTLQVAVGGRFVTVAPGEVLETPPGWETTHYVQTGEHGEEPLFVRIDTKPKE